MKKILSGFLAFCMVIGIIISSVPSLTVSAAKQVSPNPDLDYLKNKIASKQEKLDTMQLMLTKGNYELYYEKYTGEVAVKNTVTGDIMMTNPYDVGSASASDNVKNQLLSQIILKYTNLQGNEIQMYSYVEAALRSQIKVSYIKNGIRVEYVMGKQESRSLVPRYIEKSRFENLILANITDNARKAKLLSFYYLKDPNDKTLTAKLITEMEKKYPVTKDGMAIYVIDENSKEGELSKLEAIIKEFCPAYTYETLQEDHDMTQYESEAKNPVQFRMSLEYTLDENGLSVRLPANGIRFDQSTYTLNYIGILPYFGAGSSQFKGYTMIPDGSGALVRFEDVLEAGQSRLITGKLYGQDYAYHEIAGANQQPMRMPVFGLVENTTIKENKITEEVVPCDPTDEGVIVNEEGVVVFEETGEPATKTVTKTEAISYDRSNGWFAVIENGDSLATIGSDHGGNLTHKYNSVFTELNPRPSDSYNLGSSISVAGDATWTVVSERKYTGNYRIRYMMLTDHNYASENKLETAGLFDTDYVGMALTYRNYLEKNGMIQKLEKTSQIPLYLETLGSMDVMEKVLSVPVNVKKSLTSFEDIKTMTNELAEAGITNLVYKLTGYINGGLKRTLPTKIKVQKEVGGNKGLTDLINWGAEKGIDFFLDIDFSYAQKDKMFDGFYKKTDAVKTIDDRYTRKRTYSAVYQSFTNTGLIAVSPSIFGSIFDKAKSYLEDLGVKAVALGTLGSDLNSDFDEDDPYNREDSEENVVEALAKVK
ncbi:MAG: hypothetical protein KBT31_02160, partial [Firmicutes bacterium]|nr:hypothetical protein [Candidatus Colimorpha enterica]